MSTKPPVTRPSLQDRLTAKQNALNTPQACPRCGSTFFLELHANQYAQGGFGSVAFRRINIAPQMVHYCLCGQLIPGPQAAAYGAGAVGSGEVAAFNMSVKAAQEELKKHDPNELIQIVAAKRELDDLRRELEALRENLDGQIMDITSQIEALEKTEGAPIPYREATPAPGTSVGPEPPQSTPNAAAASRAPKKWGRRSKLTS